MKIINEEKSIENLNTLVFSDLISICNHLIVSREEIYNSMMLNDSDDKVQAYQRTSKMLFLIQSVIMRRLDSLFVWVDSEVQSDITDL